MTRVDTTDCPSFLGKKGYALALIAGALMPLSFAPYDFWPAGIASLLLLLVCLESISSKQAILVGWLYGLGMFGAGVSWVYVSIHQFGQAPIPLAAFLTLLFSATLALLFCATFTYSYVRFFAAKRWGMLLGFPALWVLFEWSRSWVFTGFPWLFLGYGYTDTWLANLAPITGVYGLSLMAAISASSLYSLARSIFTRSKEKTWIYPLILILPWAAGYDFKDKTWVIESEDTIKVTLLQPNISQDLKWKPEQQSKTLRLMYQESRKHLDSDIIVWPENGIPLFHHQAQNYLQAINEMAAESNTAILSGIPYWERNSNHPNGVMHNSVIATGNVPAEDLYHKQKLVPFGEYVPLEDQLRGLIAFFDLPMSNFRPGAENQTALTVNVKGKPVRIAPYICYEIVYPDFVRKLGQTSDVLLTISDDSWFGGSIGPHQHMQMARMRALESGRYLIRGTNTGITAIVNHRGKIISRAEQFKQTSLTGEIKITSGQTPFLRWGSMWTLLLCVLALFATLIFGRGKPAQ